MKRALATSNQFANPLIHTESQLIGTPARPDGGKTGQLLPAKLRLQNQPLFARIIVEPCVIFYTVSLATIASQGLEIHTLTIRAEQ